MAHDPLPFYLGGDWKGASRPEASASILNPFDNSLVANITLATSENADRAIERCRSGFQKTRSLQAFERFDILSTIASGIRERREEFAALITAEVGKPLAASRAEVDRSILTFQLAAEEARRIGGEVLPLDISPAGQNRFGMVRRFPLGIILAIAPFNFPLNLVAHKVAPAIAAGNAFILKPAPQACCTSLRLAELILAAGYPPEAFSVLPTTNDVAEFLVRDERIAMVSFTGSPAVGWRIKSQAGKKKVLLELGGNAGVIVDRSANVDEAVKKNLIGSFVYSGQVCIKVQRIYVHADVSAEYLEKFVQGAKKLPTGDPRDPGTMIGPVVNDAARDRILSVIAEARSEGATLLTGGGHSARVIEPTVLDNVPRTSKAFCTEVFGPVVTLHQFNSFEEAVAGVNDSPFGLQAGVFSNDYRNILSAYNTLDVAGVIVNDNPTFRVDNMPYGGIKESGFGREGVKYAIEAMTEPKLLAFGT